VQTKAVPNPRPRSSFVHSSAPVTRSRQYNFPRVCAKTLFGLSASETNPSPKPALNSWRHTVSPVVASTQTTLHLTTRNTCKSFIFSLPNRLFSGSAISCPEAKSRIRQRADGFRGLISCPSHAAVHRALSRRHNGRSDRHLPSVELIAARGVGNERRYRVRVNGRGSSQNRAKIHGRSLPRLFSRDEFIRHIVSK
jgi:hypothetical protein